MDGGDGAGGVREDLGPVVECLISAEQDGLAGVVTMGDDLEEEIGVAVAVLGSYLGLPTFRKD